MTDDPKKSPDPATSSDVPSDMPSRSSADEQPEIYGISKGKNGIVLNRRSFLGALGAAGALAGAGCIPLPGFGGSDPEVAKDGAGKAHGSWIFGLLLRDASLFSWDENILKSWDIAKGKLQQSVPKTALGQTLKQAGSAFPSLLEKLWEGPQRAFGPEGNFLAIRVKEGITQWKTANGKPVKIRTLREVPPKPSVLAIHPDGAKVAVANEDGVIVVWTDGKKRQFQADPRRLLSLAFHPTEPLLLSGHSNGVVREWRLPGGKAGKTLTCHATPIRCLAVTPDGKLAVTASDGPIKLWSLPEGKEAASLSIPLEEMPIALALAADGHLLAAGTSQGRIYLWRLPEGEMIGCLFDPALLDQGTPMAQHRQMGTARTWTQPCGTPIPPDATCLCDCVAADRTCRSTTQTVCICDTIAVPAGYTGGNSVCVCNTILVGTKSRPSCSCVGNVCSCVGNVTHGSHYWRPN